MKEMGQRKINGREQKISRSSLYDSMMTLFIVVNEGRDCVCERGSKAQNNRTIGRGAKTIREVLAARRCNLPRAKNSTIGTSNE
jgi:hypothetical protein